MTTRVDAGTTHHVLVSASYNHVAAVSDGGDMYTWGAGRHGQLGHADFDDHVLPKLNLTLQVRCAAGALTRGGGFDA